MVQGRRDTTNAQIIVHLFHSVNISTLSLSLSPSSSLPVAFSLSLSLRPALQCVVSTTGLGINIDSVRAPDADNRSEEVSAVTASHNLLWEHVQIMLSPALQWGKSKSALP